MPASVACLAKHMVLGALLEDLTVRHGGYELAAHWTQGEFHHDMVLRLPERGASGLPGRVLVVATNCNGGIKEVLCFAEVPDRGALWHHRCPAVREFSGKLAPILDRAVTEHWFHPCELLAADAPALGCVSALARIPTLAECSDLSSDGLGREVFPRRRFSSFSKRRSTARSTTTARSRSTFAWRMRSSARSGAGNRRARSACISAFVLPAAASTSSL